MPPLLLLLQQELQYFLASYQRGTGAKPVPLSNAAHSLCSVNLLLLQKRIHLSFLHMIASGVFFLVIEYLGFVGNCSLLPAQSTYKEAGCWVAGICLSA